MNEMDEMNGASEPNEPEEFAEAGAADETPKPPLTNEPEDANPLPEPDMAPGFFAANEAPVSEPPVSEPLPSYLAPAETRIPPSDKKPGGMGRVAMVISGVVALAAIGCCAIMVVVLALDPFGWGLVGRLTGSYDPVAQVMPAETGMYAGMNLLNLTPEKVNRLITPFQGAIEDVSGEGASSYEDLIKQFEDSLPEGTDFTVAGDIIPWIGQYAGIGLYDFEIGDYGQLEQAEFVIAVEIRSTKAADSFIAKLEKIVAAEQDKPFTAEEYRGATIHAVEGDTPTDGVAFARSGRLFLLSNTTDSLKAAIDAQKKTSFGDDKAYKDLMKTLPKERAVSIYMTGEQLAELNQANLRSVMGAASSGILDLYNSYDGMAIALSITEQGLQIDGATSLKDDAGSAELIELNEKGRSQAKTANNFPEDTFFYMTAAHLDLTWEFTRTSLAELAGGDDLDEAMAALESQIGFNPETDLIPYLDGEFALGLFPSSQGLLADSANMDLGFGLMVGYSVEEKIQAVTGKFISLLETQGLVMNDISANSVTVYEAVIPYSEQKLFALGYGQNYLTVASGGDDLNRFFADGNSLANSLAYRQVWEAFPQDTTPLMYINVGGLIDAIQGGLSGYELESFNEVAQVLKPIEYIAAGNGLPKDGIYTGRVVFFLP